MTITSFYFLCFIIVGALVYYIIPRRFQWLLLLMMSIIYYVVAQSLMALVYPVMTVLTVYLCALGISKTNSEKGKKRFLYTGCIITILLLILVKYIPREVYLNDALVSEYFGDLLLIVPLGISFYTFSLLGYLFDVYYEMGPVEKNIAHVATFGLLFTNMTSGPIMRYSDVSKSLFEGHRFDYMCVTRGCQRILWGFFEKLVLAERLAKISDEIFTNYADYNGMYILVGMVSFTLQLYTDFSGCMDIVIGIVEALQIEMPENFKHPFMAVTIQEFWQRWHITLGNWLKNYLFYPVLRTNFFMKLPKILKEKVGKKAAKKITTYLAMLILWTVIGAWHGGAWHFIIGVGILQWIYIVVGELLEPLWNRVGKSLRIEKNGKVAKIIGRTKVFVLMTLALALFRANTIRDMFAMCIRVISKEGWTPQLVAGTFIGMEWYEWCILIISLVAFAFVGIIDERENDRNVREMVGGLVLPLRWLIWMVLIMWVIILGWYGPGFSAAEFIYQGF